MNNSGWHWDDKTGASITPVSASTWDGYVNKHPMAKPFRNAGWPHRSKVADIVPHAATGANVYHPSSQTPFVNSQPDSPSPLKTPGSPAWDIEEPLDVDDEVFFCCLIFYINHD